MNTIVHLSLLIGIALSFFFLKRRGASLLIIINETNAQSTRESYLRVKELRKLQPTTETMDIPEQRKYENDLQ